MSFAEIMEQIAENARIANAPVEGDYVKDGLLYCHKCNTPKECMVKNPFFSNTYDKRSCTCRCKREANEREKNMREAADVE